MRSLYDTLGLGPQATDDEIRQAFRRIAKERHPDTAAGNEAAMKRLNEAYDTLKDPDRRRAYDRSLKLPVARRTRRAPPPVDLDPEAFWAQIIVPLDREVTSALRDLQAGIDDVAEDCEDEAAVTAFDLMALATEQALIKALNRLAAVNWPPTLSQTLTRYRDGLNLAAAAAEILGSYSLDLDVAALDAGRAQLHKAATVLAEGRRR